MLRRAEEIAASAQFVVIAPPELLSARIARVPDNLMEPLGIADGERSQHVRVEDGEGDRDESQANGKRQDGRDRKRRAVPHTTPRVPKILNQVFDCCPPARLVKALFDPRHVAERFQRRRTRRIRADAVSDQTLGFEIEMCLDLLRKVLVGPTPGEQPHGYVDPWPRTRAMAAARRFQRCDC